MSCCRGRLVRAERSAVDVACAVRAISKFVVRYVNFSQIGIAFVADYSGGSNNCHGSTLSAMAIFSMLPSETFQMQRSTAEM